MGGRRGRKGEISRVYNTLLFAWDKENINVHRRRHCFRLHLFGGGDHLMDGTEWKAEGQKKEKVYQENRRFALWIRKQG